MRCRGTAGDQNPSFADLRTFLLRAAEVAAAFAVEREDVLGRHVVQVRVAQPRLHLMKEPSHPGERLVREVQLHLLVCSREAAYAGDLLAVFGGVVVLAGQLFRRSGETLGTVLA